MTSTTTEDPWAEAVTDDGDGAAAELSFEDEFGTAEDSEKSVGTALPVGTKLPGFPRMHQLFGRLLIVEPISFDPEAPTYNAKVNGKTGDTEECFKVRVTVLDGAPITVPEQEKQADGSWKKTGDKVSPEYPVVFYGMNITSGRLIKQLKEVFDVKTGEKRGPGKRLGRLRRAGNRTFPKSVTALPWAQQYDRCDEIAAQYAKDAQAALANGEKPEAEPKFSAMISAYTPADVEIAKTYLAAERAERAARKSAA